MTCAAYASKASDCPRRAEPEPRGATTAMALNLPQPANPGSASRMSPRQRAYRHWQKGQGHAVRKQWPNAASAFEQASALDGDVAYALAAVHALIKSGSNAQALLRARRLRLRWPGEVLGYTLEAQALLKLARPEEAVQCLEPLPPEAPRDHGYWITFAGALQQSNRPAEAISAFMNALVIKPDDASTHYWLGVAFQNLGLKAEAGECIRTALALGLGSAEMAARGLLALLEREACLWPAADASLAALRERLRVTPQDAPLATSPFAHAVLVDDPQEQLKVARLYALDIARGVQPLPRRAPVRRPGRLRVAYLSSDFQRHATSQLMAQMLECHDRDAFEVTLLSTGADNGGDMRSRIRAASEHFEDLRGAGFAAIAARVRELGIDILVDLKGATFDTPFPVLAYRAAPLQVAWLGFPGSTGAEYVDYIVGDRIVTPLEHAAHFSEKIAQMPHCYQPNDAARAMPAASTRAQWGVPEDKLLLCGFHQPQKISAEVFDTWCEVLHARPDAVLWLLAWNLNIETTLLDAAKALGIDPERIVFAPLIPVEEHLTRLACADVFLDAWPCNGHTTAGEALWCGVPVVTLQGETFAQRVASSLLHTVGLDDLVCTQLDDYRSQVLALCSDAPRRAAIRDHLHAQRTESPLFDGRRFARDIEALYRRMWERAVDGEAPGHLPAVTSG